MILRSLFSITLIGALFLLPQSALAREVGPTWESRTNGLPLSTVQGEWIESADRRSVELSFLGGHVIEAGTTFKATWRSPFTSRGEPAKFEGGYELENHNEVGETVLVNQTFRFRYRGEPWQDGIESRVRLKPGVTFLRGGSFFEETRRSQVQFEWSWSGAIEAPTYLRGSAELAIN